MGGGQEPDDHGVHDLPGQLGARDDVEGDGQTLSRERVVAYGKANRNLDHITAIGVDEIQRFHGQRSITMVYQFDAGCRRLLWIGRGRTKKAFKPFFTWFGVERCARVQFFCSDMWRPYLDLIAMHAPNAINVLDRFHLVTKLGKAVDKVRSAEMAKLVNLNLKTIKAYFFRLDLDRLLTYSIPEHAGEFLDDWCRRVMRSRIKPMMAIAKSFRVHRPLILNYFRACKVFSSGVVEGHNIKAKVGMRRAYGNRSDDVLEIALFHQLSALPEPPVTHRFSG